jgi:hypothetical protein
METAFIMLLAADGLLPISKDTQRNDVAPYLFPTVSIEHH